MGGGQPSFTEPIRAWPSLTDPNRASAIQFRGHGGAWLGLVGHGRAWEGMVGHVKGGVGVGVETERARGQGPGPRSPGAQSRGFHQRNRSPSGSGRFPSLDSSTRAQPRVMATDRLGGTTTTKLEIPEGTYVEVLHDHQPSGSEWVRVQVELYVPNDYISCYMWHLRSDEPQNLSALRDNPTDSGNVSQHTRLTPNERVALLKIQGDWALVQFCKLSPTDGPEKG